MRCFDSVLITNAEWRLYANQNHRVAASPSGRGRPAGVSLRRFLGSRNRALAALAPGGQRSFPMQRAPAPGPAAGAAFFRVPAGKTSWPPGPPGLRAPSSASLGADRRAATAARTAIPDRRKDA